MEEKSKLKKLIDKGIGMNGDNLKIPSFWMREIFLRLMNWVEASTNVLYPADMNNDFNNDFAN